MWTFCELVWGHEPVNVRHHVATAAAVDSPSDLTHRRDMPREPAPVTETRPAKMKSRIVTAFKPRRR
jgi:hypothetical protein